MAENVLALKKQALKLGMTRDDAIKASRKQLEDFIASAGKSKSKKDKTEKVEKSSKKKTAKKKAGSKKTKTEKPKVEKAKKTGSKSKAKKSADKPKPKTDDEAGRNQISTLDWQIESEDWNPRSGGATERMFKALKKAKGSVDKAFDALVDDLYDFVGKKKQTGEKRTKAEAEAMLRYRLNRTKYEFATKTGQHESATNRIEYGSGSKAKSKPKPKAEKPKAKAGSKKKSKPKK